MWKDGIEVGLGREWVDSERGAANLARGEDRYGQNNWKTDIAAELQLADFQDTWDDHTGVGSDNAALADDVVAHRKAQSRVDNVVTGNRYVPPFGFRRKQ